MGDRKISVLFEPRDQGVGFARVQICTRSLQWTVSERHFEEIHGLSRVVLVIPDKVVTTFAVIQDLYPQRSDNEGFLIGLVLDLCKRYIDIATARPVEQPFHPDGNGHVEYLFEFGAAAAADSSDVAVGNEHPLGFHATLCALRDELAALQPLAVPNGQDDYFVAADDLVKFCDEIREACLVYLEFAHPVLIRSRREGAADLGEDTVEQRFAAIGNLLNRRCAQIEKDYRGMLGEI